MESRKNKYIVEPAKDTSVDNSTFVKTDDDEQEKLKRQSVDSSIAQADEVGK